MPRGRRTAEASSSRHLFEDRDVVTIDHAAAFSLLENRFHIFPSNQRRLYSTHFHQRNRRNGGGVGWQTTSTLRRKGRMPGCTRSKRGWGSFQTWSRVWLRRRLRWTAT